MLPLTTTLILWAMFLQVFLTMFVLFKLGMVRKKALDEKAVTWDEIATNHWHGRNMSLKSITIL